MGPPAQREETDTNWPYASKSTRLLSSSATEVRHLLRCIYAPSVRRSAPLVHIYKPHDQLTITAGASACIEHPLFHIHTQSPKKCIREWLGLAWAGWRGHIREECTKSRASTRWTEQEVCSIPPKHGTAAWTRVFHAMGSKSTRPRIWRVASVWRLRSSNACQRCRFTRDRRRDRGLDEESWITSSEDAH